jgi:hypothetical protein
VTVTGQSDLKSARTSALDKACSRTLGIFVGAATVVAFLSLAVYLELDASAGGAVSLVVLLWLGGAALVATAALTARLVLGGLREAAYAEDLDAASRRREAASG